MNNACIRATYGPWPFMTTHSFPQAQGHEQCTCRFDLLAKGGPKGIVEFRCSFEFCKNGTAEICSGLAADMGNGNMSGTRHCSFDENKI